MSYLIAIDGGGTHTTLALGHRDGREILRRKGPAGIVDPRDPAAAAGMLAELVRSGVAEAGLTGLAGALCAGLAGVGSLAEREIVEAALREAGLARHVLVRPDGETALQGALGDSAGLLLIAGTGSVGWGRGEDGRVAWTGGWGKIVGDEGSGYGLAIAGLVAALRATDGRGPETRLLPTLLHAIDAADALAVPPWVGRAEKSQIAALAVPVVQLARDGDPVAVALVQEAAAGLAAHATALISRLGPWTAPTPVVFHGGLASNPTFAAATGVALGRGSAPVERRDPLADAVTGAMQFARAAADSP